jgi:hypothetical protein
VRCVFASNLASISGSKWIFIILERRKIEQDLRGLMSDDRYAGSFFEGAKVARAIDVFSSPR